MKGLGYLPPVRADAYCHRERGAVLLMLLGGGLLLYWLADCWGLLLILMGAAAVLLVRGYGRGAGMVMGRNGAKLI